MGRTSSDLYFRVDGLLRKLANTNLHDIANMSFKVELWDRYANHVRWVVAAAGTVTIGQAASMRQSQTGRTNALRCGRASCSFESIRIGGRVDVPLARTCSLA
jgi:hypothetical protein